MLTFACKYLKIIDYNLDGYFTLEMLDIRQHPIGGPDAEYLIYPCRVHPFYIDKRKIYVIPEVKYMPLSPSTYKTCPYHIVENGVKYYLLKGVDFNTTGFVYKIDERTIKNYYRRYTNNSNVYKAEELSISRFEDYLGQIIASLPDKSQGWIHYVDPIMGYAEEDLQLIMRQVVLEDVHFELEFVDQWTVEKEIDVHDMPFDGDISYMEFQQIVMVRVKDEDGNSMYLNYRAKLLKEKS